MSLKCETVTQLIVCVYVASSFTHKIKLVILLIDCDTILIMSVQRIWFWISKLSNPLIDIFLYSYHMPVDILLML